MALLVGFLLYALFPAAMAYAAASDLLTMTIPNRLVVFLIVGFLVLAPFTGMSWHDFGLHWATAGAVLVAGFIMLRVRLDRRRRCQARRGHRVVDGLRATASSSSASHRSSAER